MVSSSSSPSSSSPSSSSPSSSSSFRMGFMSRLCSRGWMDSSGSVRLQQVEISAREGPDLERHRPSEHHLSSGQPSCSARMRYLAASKSSFLGPSNPQPCKRREKLSLQQEVGMGHPRVRFCVELCCVEEFFFWGLQILRPPPPPALCWGWAATRTTLSHLVLSTATFQTQARAMELEQWLLIRKTQACSYAGKHLFGRGRAENLEQVPNARSVMYLRSSW